jgi:phosphoglycolate phosphatase
MRNILFDLDGTLTDSSLGITRCVQYAMEQLGRPAPPADELLFCIGPPLIESFTVLIPDGSPDLPRQAVLHYRDRFDAIGKFENHVYEDIPAALAELQELDCRLYLATSKAEYFARQILDHFELSSFFTGIHGARLDGSLCDKGELIGHILHQEGLSTEETLMVGDRKHDMIGAAACRISSIGVTYGFGSAQELNAHGAHHLVHEPLAIPRLITRLRHPGANKPADTPRQ